MPHNSITPSANTGPLKPAFTGAMDVVFADDQMRARTHHAAHNLSVVRPFPLNLIRYAPVKRKGGLKAHRLRAASSIAYREELLGLL